MLLSKQAIMAVFQKLSARGYASGEEAIIDQHLLQELGVPRGFKAFCIVEPHNKEDNKNYWQLIDAYTVGKNGRSAGYSILYYIENDHEIPVLFVSYGGSVHRKTCEELGINPKEVTNFLRKALKFYYEKCCRIIGETPEALVDFNAGRGPMSYKESFPKGKLEYRLTLPTDNSLRQFSAKEQIFWIPDGKGVLGSYRVFEHTINGMLLVETAD